MTRQALWLIECACEGHAHADCKMPACREIVTFLIWLSGSQHSTVQHSAHFVEHAGPCTAAHAAASPRRQAHPQAAALEAALCRPPSPTAPTPAPPAAAGRAAATLCLRRLALRPVAPALCDGALRMPTWLVCRTLVILCRHSSSSSSQAPTILQAPSRPGRQQRNQHRPAALVLALLLRLQELQQLQQAAISWPTTQWVRLHPPAAAAAAVGAHPLRCRLPLLLLPPPTTHQQTARRHGGSLQAATPS